MLLMDDWVFNFSQTNKTCVDVRPEQTWCLSTSNDLHVKHGALFI